MFPRDNFPKGHFVQGTLCPRDNLPKGQFAQGTISLRYILPMGQFAQWTLFPRTICLLKPSSLTGWFIYILLKEHPVSMEHPVSIEGFFLIILPFSFHKTFLSCEMQVSLETGTKFNMSAVLSPMWTLHLPYIYAEELCTTFSTWLSHVCWFLRWLYLVSHCHLTQEKSWH